MISRISPRLTFWMCHIGYAISLAYSHYLSSSWYVLLHLTANIWVLKRDKGQYTSPNFGTPLARLPHDIDSPQRDSRGCAKTKPLTMTDNEFHFAIFCLTILFGFVCFVAGVEKGRTLGPAPKPCKECDRGLGCDYSAPYTQCLCPCHEANEWNISGLSFQLHYYA